MSHNTIGLLKANGQIEEYGSTGGGGSDSSFIGTHAEWNALTTEQKALYEIVNFTDDSATPEIVDPVPTQNSTHLVNSGGVWDCVHGIHTSIGASIEYTNIATHPYAVGNRLLVYVNGVGYLAKAIAAIAIGDTLVVGSNFQWYTLITDIDEKAAYLEKRIGWNADINYQVQTTHDDVGRVVRETVFYWIKNYGSDRSGVLTWMWVGHDYMMTLYGYVREVSSDFDYLLVNTFSSNGLVDTQHIHL